MVERAVPPVLFPLMADLTGVSVLVVGGGPVAARKAASRIRSGALVTLVAPAICAEAADLDVTIDRRTYRSGEAALYRLVVTATGVTEVDQQVYDDAVAAEVWVNSADDPARCTFILPAVLRHGPVVMSVSTSGTSPALAGWLRDRLAEEYGEWVVGVAADLAAQRERLRADGTSTESIDWRPLIESAVARARPS